MFSVSLTESLASLGIMAWPLLITSCLGLAMILERLVTYAMLPSLRRKGLNELFNEVRSCCGCDKSAQRKDNLCQNLCKGKGIRQGIALLLSHNKCTKAVREEVAGLWLLKQKRSLNAWLKPLELVVGDGQWLSLFRPHALDFPGFRDLIFGEKMGEVQNSLALLECLSSLSMRAPWRVKKTSESTMFCLTSRSLKLC